MYAFLLLAIPCTLLYFLHSSLAKGSYWAAFSIGFFPAVIYCFIDEFFIFSIHRFTDSFAAYYAYTLIKDHLLPSLALCSLYFLISRRELKDRSFSLLVLLCAFYMIYMPYGVLTGEERFSSYLCFIKPLLTGASIIILSLSCIGLFQSLEKGTKSLAAAFAFGIPIALFIPPLAEGIWYLNDTSALYLAIAVGMSVLAILLCIFLCKIRGKTLDKSI